MKNAFLATLLTGTLIASAGASMAADKPLKNIKDQSPVVLTGTVGEIRSDEFDLNYGNNTITVELDRFGWDGDETKYLIPGESVTVNGFIDDDLFEGREIEAYNIRMNDSFVYYYTSQDYPIYHYTYNTRTPLRDGAFVTAQGRVTDIAGRELTIQTSEGSVIVDTSKLDYDPFDDEGLQNIKIGDTIYTYGEVDKGFFESDEIMAEGIIEMMDSARGEG